MMTRQITFTDTILEVPYYSQYRDVKNPDSRIFSCGMTCVYMALAYFGAKLPSLDELIARGMREGGYGDSGWIHDYSVSLIQRFGFGCERKEQMSERDITQIRNAIKIGNPVIISTQLRLWDQRKFHQVLLVGVREGEGGEIAGFFYHDPAGSEKDALKNYFVPLPAFFLDWRRMAIFPKK